jgi:peptide/nickel transport system ATP-binding protein
VGTSGSGKSTLALAVLGLLECRSAKVTGRIEFDGRDLTALSAEQMRRIRGREISLVLQSPMSALNPVLRIGSQFREAWISHSPRKSDWVDAAREALENVSLPCDDAFLRRYPRELSVGQAQRVLIAMAILHCPGLLIADEPTSALDVITQAEILNLFASINRRLGTAILYISHDLFSISRLCDRVAILHEGEIVEIGETERLMASPSHPYTRRLIQSSPLSVSVPNKLKHECLA